MRQVFYHQSEARTAATVWNWSGKTLSPGALLAVLHFSFVPYFSSLRSRRRKGKGIGDREEEKKGRGIGERGRGRLL